MKILNQKYGEGKVIFFLESLLSNMNFRVYSKIKTLNKIIFYQMYNPTMLYQNYEGTMLLM